jgi:hypothetical protein
LAYIHSEFGIGNPESIVSQPLTRNSGRCRHPLGGK